LRDIVLQGNRKAAPHLQATGLQEVVLPALFSDNLHQRAFPAVAVEFTIENLFPRAEIQLPFGYTQAVSPYRHELHNAGGKTLGFYNPHIDRTFEASGRLVGKGNLLASLLR